MHTVGNEHMMVATGEAAKVFNGLVRNNTTANCILEQLLQETTMEEIVTRICDKYEASEEVVMADVNREIEEIRKAGFLDE